MKQKNMQQAIDNIFHAHPLWSCWVMQETNIGIGASSENSFINLIPSGAPFHLLLFKLELNQVSRKAIYPFDNYGKNIYPIKEF